MFLIRDLRHAYNGSDALQIRNWQAEQGEHWLVLGPSGSGKTTLLHILGGILKPSYGEVLVAGQPLMRLKPRALDRFRGRHVGIVLQRLHLVDSLTVEDNIILAQFFSRLPPDPYRAREVLADLGLEDKADAYPHELSFGQAQRVAVARAVVNRPTLLLADEPTSNLDDAHAMQTLDLLESQANACRATLLIATHDQRIKSRFRRQYALGSP
ncbi:MAG TPA: ABC transporter ATP-binding protein [Burkholderiales bacterium]|nr:ABC transporter ATP-binding protein [Burkholderiales bacterium]